ncbi:ABC transporter ATP-binding protein [Terriglobus roseus]|uniref:Lipoprotein-releasing system ATP-binding protein n=1 Tax=Terriglobus roseus TaxID=392734 RepID=A0A1G7KBU8_9BACT|nr:ABC transporter ATP-binding protein [Terriglobus roseus]SDF34632.1 lipoprotein-releasing system ATP-binding protein [Terriglobus roseus]
MLAAANPIVVVKDLTKSYTTGTGTLTLFRDLSFTVATGEMLAIIGASGAGKSTLLHMLAAMDSPTSGDVLIDGTSLASLKPAEQADFRNRTIGYVWQAHYLLPEFTAEENVAMPLLARGESQPEAHEKARRWLTEVGLAARASHRSGELSGGEQQRVSLARALVTEPKLLLADEPTGNLDAATGDSIFDLLRRLHATHGTTTVMVTHNHQIAARCDRTLVLHEGHLIPSEIPA